MIRFSLLIFAVILSSAFSLAEEGTFQSKLGWRTLEIHTSDSSVTIGISDDLRLAAGPMGLRITSDIMDLTVPSEEFHHISFSGRSMTEIVGDNTDLIFKLTDGFLLISPKDSPTVLNVYEADGSLEDRMNVNGEYAYDLRSLSSGIHIFNVGNKTLKISL